MRGKNVNCRSHHRIVSSHVATTTSGHRSAPTPTFNAPLAQEHDLKLTQFFPKSRCPHDPCPQQENLVVVQRLLPVLSLLPNQQHPYQLPGCWRAQGLGLGRKGMCAGRMTLWIFIIRAGQRKKARYRLPGHTKNWHGKKANYAHFTLPNIIPNDPVKLA